MIKLGIYGYDIKYENSFFFGRMIPYKNMDINDKKTNCYLSAFLEIEHDENTNRNIKILEAILCFIEQKEVYIKKPLKAHEDYSNLDDNYPKSLGGRKYFSAIILEEKYKKDSRKLFIEKAFDKLNSEEDAFSVMFFKKELSIKMIPSYIDVTYFLLFSGLEAFTRDYYKMYHPSAVNVVFDKIFKEFNIKIKTNESEIKRNTLVYTKLRNAIFHNGKYTTNLNNSTTGEEINLADYFYYFKNIFNIVIFKYIDFDDKSINMNPFSRSRFIKRN
ncbi:TPA: hypothetical protein ACXNOT_000752 [Proteus mirabilis]|uniref:hypothetical protein n=1 Tax=Proteus TaxID=583 RepID=UPI000F5C7054|nr:hypothetical protein [Proteus mirabilis]ELT1803392.1 hypothetical protein [Proteus mirabilis]MBG2826124.1 hypothetical protein [Proteus mirabilis]MBG3008158.1 hypothetical protein [Proteus mirabilis]MBG5959357.1 hypothetical protein [Proteus mirabilis]MBG6009036.1 hypothetical protein [Proteus mirabilis]